MIQTSNLSATYSPNKIPLKVLDNINLSIEEDTILGIAGESGSGKTTLLKILYGNIQGSLKILNGNIKYNINEFYASIPDDIDAVQKQWWRLFSYIPQQSMSVLNPVRKIKNQFYDSSITEKYTHKNNLYLDLSDYFNSLHLEESILNSYPHQLSGGMRQRVVIALATFHSPKYIFADEVTTALDVIIQKEILLLIKKIQKTMGNTIVFVSHDIGVHYQISDKLAILYAGEIVEISETQKLFSNPLHPYSKLLIESLPQIGETVLRSGISGNSLVNSPEKACTFAEKCPKVMDKCRTQKPSLKNIRSNIQVSCFLYED